MMPKETVQMLRELQSRQPSPPPSEAYAQKQHAMEVSQKARREDLNGAPSAPSRLRTGV